MPNGRTMLLIFLCVLFVVASAFGQEESDSHIITVEKKIDIAKLNDNVEDLNRNVKTLADTIDDLSENVKTLNDTVVRLDERTKGIVGWQYAIFGVVGAIFASIVIPYLRKRSGDSATATTNTRQVSQSEVSPTQALQENVSETPSAQTTGVSKDGATPVPIVQEKDFPHGNELKDELKKELYAKSRQV